MFKTSGIGITCHGDSYPKISNIKKSDGVNYTPVYFIDENVSFFWVQKHFSLFQYI